MKARYNDGSGHSLMLYGKPGEVLAVLRGMQRRCKCHEATLTEVRRPAEKAGETDWATVLRVCRDGLAKRVYTVGETLTAEHSTLGRIVWRICLVEDDRLVLVATKPVCSMVFDEGEKEESEDGEPNPFKRYRKYGYNRWEESAVRQWLNSAEGAGKWWKPQNDWDAEPSCHGKVAGFMAGFGKAFLACVRESEITTASEDGNGGYTTRDRFYLPSITEVFGEANAGVAEGEKLDLGEGFCKGQYWWLRSPIVGTANIVYFVYSSGSSNNINASITTGAVPACVIG